MDTTHECGKQRGSFWIIKVKLQTTGVIKQHFPRAYINKELELDAYNQIQENMKGEKMRLLHSFEPLFPL